MPTVLNSIHSTFNLFFEKFPPDEYNIIFKLHPVYSNANDPENLGAINYVKQITNNKITNPIIINSKIPLETLIANDYNNFKTNNIETPSILFNSNNPQVWTTYFGLQATSSTIQTTRLFYQSTFNLSDEEVALLIPFSNFPIPTTFPVVSRLSSDNLTNKNYYHDNLKQIQDIYKWYCPSIIYNNSSLKKYDSIILNFD